MQQLGEGNRFPEFCSRFVLFLQECSGLYNTYYVNVFGRYRKHPSRLLSLESRAKLLLYYIPTSQPKGLGPQNPTKKLAHAGVLLGHLYLKIVFTNLTSYNFHQQNEDCCYKILEADHESSDC